MKEDESFDEFYVKLKDVVNSAFNPWETIPKPKIVRKVLRSLPERFHAKITAIKESKDIDKIPLTELVGNLQTYELGLTRIGKTGKGKSMALKAKSSEIDESSDDEDSKMKSYITRQFKKFMKNANGKGFDKDHKGKSMALKAKSSETDESSDDEDFKMKSYITRQFKKFMKNTNGKGFDKDRRQSYSSQFKGQDKGKKDVKEGGQYTVPIGPKCFGCQGFGHMKNKCLTYLKSIGKSKALAVTLSDIGLRMIPTMRMTES